MTDTRVDEAAKLIRACYRMLDQTTDPVQVEMINNARSRATRALHRALDDVSDQDLYRRLGLDALSVEIALTRAAQALTSEPVPEVETASGENVT